MLALVNFVTIFVDLFKQIYKKFTLLVMTLEQLKKKLWYNDYKLLAAILGITPSAARLRFLRGDLNSQEIMEMIVKNRENLIQEYAK